VPRMKLFALALAICLGATCPGFAGPADAYPTRPVRVLVGFSPGGAVDVIARARGTALGAVRPALRDREQAGRRVQPGRR
jgi:tripartite-type tricarboxylate transporter receptor subunit TctC